MNIELRQVLIDYINKQSTTWILKSLKLSCRDCKHHHHDGQGWGCDNWRGFKNFHEFYDNEINAKCFEFDKSTKNIFIEKIEIKYEPREEVSRK